MIRLSLLWLYVIGFSLYAFKDWYKSLCALILLMAVVEHPDMPKSLFGVQGLNPWNVLLLAVLLGWALSRGSEGLRWDAQPHLVTLLLLYLGVVVVAFIRMMADRGAMRATGIALVSEHLLNTLKWPIPGLLLFDGCRTRQRQLLAVVSILGLYAALAVQVIRWMPPQYVLSGSDLSSRALKIVQNEIGYSRVSMSMLLAGGSWALFSVRPLLWRGWQWWLLSAGFLGMVYAQALTGGRMGYLTWGVVGLVLALFRWRSSLLVAALVVAAVAVAVPGARERMMEGMQPRDELEEETIDEYQVLSGRNLAWPLVIDAIQEAPVLGYGTLAMIRTGIWAKLGEEGFPHPHNAYLELLLDAGVLGFALVMPFYVVTLFHSLQLLGARQNRMWSAVGGMALSLVLALLVAGMGSQTFYPRQSSVGMWAAIGLMYRLSLERTRVMTARRAARWSLARARIAAAS